ncbi:MAG TPA: hypothetical protein ENK88_07545 [Campylobacterales bacterium]|nr:hypothetical protein [Campylobacterales bacterium]HHC11444.1 hypothetical protein [Campylobacterales bacterium]
MHSILILLIVSFGLLNANGGLLKVNWSKTVVNQQKLRVLPKILKEGIKDVTLPVYIPKYYIYQKDISVVSDANFYAITIFLDKARLMISGDRTYQEKVVSKGKNLKFKMKATENRFIQAEGIMSTDFHKNGVNYSLVLECDAPYSDPRCTEDTFLKRVYNGLILIGGKR